VSAKENTNVEQMFGYLARTIKDQVLSAEVPIQPRAFSYAKPLNAKEPAKRGRGCC
jgi:hypothetical protein